MSMRTLSVLLVSLVVMAPLASANHGLNGRIVATLDDGTLAEAKMTYVTGNFNTQTWAFTWTVDGASFTCNGFGSIEVGFTSVNCATAWSTGATGDSHTYGTSEADMHDIAVSVGGVSGSGTQIVCADSGPAGAGCNLALGLAPL